MAIRDDPSEDLAFSLRIKLQAEKSIKFIRQVLESCNNIGKGFNLFKEYSQICFE